MEAATCRMLARPCSSGKGTSTLRDRRPGRVSAASSTCAAAAAAVSHPCGLRPSRCWEKARGLAGALRPLVGSRYCLLCRLWTAESAIRACR